jgi:hypothetical protein
MPAFIFLGWLVGLLLGVTLGSFGLLVLGLPIATLVALLAGTPLGFLGPLITALAGALGGLAALVAGLLAGLSMVVIAVLLVLVLLVATALVYLAGYGIATAAITPLLPAGTTFPLPGPLTPTAATTIAASPGEFFARGLMSGFNAVLNAMLILALALFDPRWAPILASYAFIVITGAAILFVARNRIYQGFLGWSAWLFPMSYVATLPGLLLFLFNTLASVLGRVPGFTVALDFTTGVVESSGGFILSLSGFSGGFSLGNFTFLMRSAPAAAFTVPSVSSHETGHSLNTAAYGGVVLWINAIDENVPPFARFNLAYGELLAEGHAVAMPGTPRTDFSLRLWF